MESRVYMSSARGPPDRSPGQYYAYTLWIIQLPACCWSLIFLSSHGKISLTSYPVFFLALSMICSEAVLQALIGYTVVCFLLSTQSGLKSTLDFKLCLATHFFKILLWYSKLNDDLSILGWVFFFSSWLNACHWLNGWGSHRDKGLLGSQHTLVGYLTNAVSITSAQGFQC